MTQPNTIGARILFLLKRKQAFLQECLHRISSDAFRIIKLYHPGKFTRLFNIRIIRQSRKSQPYAFFQIPTLVFISEYLKQEGGYGSPEAPIVPEEKRFPTGEMPLQRVFSRLERDLPLKQPGTPARQSADLTMPAEQSTERSEPPAMDQTIELSPKLKDRFSNLLNLRLPRVFIHKNVEAERMLGKRNADAMTLGSNIYFRNPMDFNKSSDAALLGHELTHVAQQDTAEWRNPRAASVNSERQEYAALANERLVLRHASVFTQSKGPSTAASVASPTPQPGTSAAPMFAESSRSLGAVPEPPAAGSESGTGGLPIEGVAWLKEEIYRDLMMRIKIDFERGG